jgi:hypothetical protein
MDAEKLKADAETAVANAEDNFARSRKLPPYFSEASYQFKDADMSEAKIRAMLQKQWPNCAKIKKIVVLESHSGEEWRVSTNDLGVPRYKYSWPEILAVYEGKDGWCYYVKNISFKRDYQGGGKYGSVIFYNDDNRHYKMDCKNVK